MPPANMAPRVEGRMEWIDTVPLPALRVDAQGRVAAANRLAAKLFDRAPAALLTRLAAELRREDPQGTSPAAEIPLADGTLLLFHEGALVSGLQQQVYHLSRLASAGRLVAVVVHEINNALSGIIGYAQYLLAQPLPPDAHRDLARVHEEALRTARVAQNLLRFSRGGRGDRSILRPDDLVARCAELKRRDFALRSIKLEFDVAPDLPPIEGDEALLSQVLINLLTNAQQSISAVRNCGNVSIRARSTRRRVIIEVTDDGPGIPAHLRERVFEPFFTSRHDGSGTGLGLTLCREILRDHSGEIRITRRGPPGATLRLSLPAATAAPPAPLAPPPPRPLPISGKRVVIVEDEPSLREVLTRSFTGHDNHVITFADGEDALPYLLSESVDLVISDMRRPGLDGIRLYEEIARTRPSLLRRILFVTGDALGKETAAFLRRSRTVALRKPLDLDELVRAARAIVEQREQQGELFAPPDAKEADAEGAAAAAVRAATPSVTAAAAGPIVEREREA
ncbi:MAG: response regulator [Planctomycetes bacterium]|nr:response regulator [Planctomycetota bacterium]